MDRSNIKIKKLAVGLAILLSASLSACTSSSSPSSAPADAGGASSQAASGQAAPSGETVTIKVAHTGNEKSKYQVGMEAFKDVVDANGGGKFQIEIFPSSLGGDRELLEALQIGTVDFAEINTSVLASVVPELAVIDLPYMFADTAHAYRVLDGEIGDGLLQTVNDKAGVQAVAYWENGFRCFTNNTRPIKAPGDLNGIVMRSMQSNIHLETFKLWGANPTPMSLSEMLTAMQQGVVQGHDNNPDTIVTNSMWEFQKYFSESCHFYGAKMLVFSNSFWSKLTDDEKEMFRQAVYEACDVEREECEVRFSSSIDLLESNGMEVVRMDEIDVPAFKESVQPIWDQYRAEFGDELINRIANA